ncbi:hypothetical protein [Bradyrhizobium sp. SBR1B]|uniref:hypothetical protein n=1 Tax=Bradyrhizobium sp. SBR1B TaxID=2663836 RepID=UPI00160676E0|nr:hypothetical protein [Bradyrhizobium sp. SBR1B]MBB4379383.1 hypothetical protein [Bradyrhizobium sp. SBR1B]
MAVKPRLDADARKAASEFFDKQVRRIYLVWVLGIAAGAIEVQLDKVSYAGISFSINSVAKLQGLIYCVVVLMYFATIGMAAVMMLQFITLERDMLRRCVYRALGKKKTLLGFTPAQHKAVRVGAITYLIATRIILGIAFAIPLAHIVLLQQPTLLSGLDLVFHTHSILPDGRINLASPALFGITVLQVTLWTMVLYRLIGRDYPGVWSAATGVSIPSIGSFALIDSYARGIPFNEAIGRVILAQMLVYILWVFPTAIGTPFLLWQDARLAYYRYKLRRIKEKQGKSGEQGDQESS